MRKILVALLFASCAAAQSDRGGMTGRVTDPSGAAQRSRNQFDERRYGSEIQHAELGDGKLSHWSLPSEDIRRRSPWRVSARWNSRASTSALASP